MNAVSTRRSFLKTGVAGTLGGASVVGRSRAAAVETSILSGRIVPENGASIGDDQVQAHSRNSSEHFRTDNDGRFEVELESNTEYQLGYYRSDSGTQLAPRKKGVPHVYNLSSAYLGSDDKDLGEMVLPQAHLIDLRVLNGNDEPLYGSKMTYRHSGWGGGNSYLSLTEQGYAILEGASFTGVELAQQARVEVEPPQRTSHGDTTFKRRSSISGPTEFVVRIDDSGATWKVQEGDGPETTQATSETTQRTSETTRATDKTTNQKTTTQSQSPSGTTTVGGTTSTSPSDGTSGPGNQTETTTTTVQSQRGFFSNGQEASDLDVLNDPFSLTVAGFVLSAAGIAHQLVRGY